MKKSESIGEKQLKIRRGRVGSLSLYEITDTELAILEKGSPSSIYLNFSIFLFSMATSFLIALCTSSEISERTFTVLVLLIILGYVLGGLLIILWLQSRKSVAEVVKKIKSRMPPEEIATTETESNI
jgi:uncharacterized membrane protein YciS (DUF1049 family)